MSDPGTPDVYQLLFEQLPPVLRWLLGVLTLGGFTLASWIWARNERNVERIERQVHQRMDREMGQIHERLDEMNRHLVQIAQNTGSGK